jgi:hypothetical protein
MKSLNKMISGLVIAVSIVSTGAVAMAAGTGTAADKDLQDTPKAAGKIMRGEGRGKGGFDKGIVKNSSENNLKALVSAGVITQEEADAAKAKLQETRATEKKAAVAEGLKGLVTAKTITQEQADKITNYIAAFEANKPAKDAAATTDQKTEKKNPLTALVDDGTLNQAQLDEVSKVVHLGGGRGHGGHGDKGLKGQTTAPAAEASATQAN